MVYSNHPHLMRCFMMVVIVAVLGRGFTSRADAFTEVAAGKISHRNVGLASIILGAIIWLLIDIGLLSADSVSAVTWIALIFLASVLTIGVSWSHFWRRVTGQVNVEHVDD